MERIPFAMALSFKEEFDLQLQQLRRFTNHGPTLGRFIELLVLNLLKKYSPKSLDYTSGFIHSLNPILENKTSNQIDIICYDRLNFPIIFDSNEFAVITPNSTKAFIEVKSILTKNSIVKGLSFLQEKLMHETPITTKLYFVATQSKISPSSVLKLLEEHFKETPNIIRFIGGVYCLAWSEMIHADLRLNPDKEELKYSCLRLSNENGIAPFFSSLLLDCCGHEAYNSIANLLTPSLFKPYDYFEVKLFGKFKL